MTTPQTGTREGPELDAQGPRVGKKYFKFGIAGLLVLLAGLCTVHFSGIIPIHRFPRILSAPFRQPERPDTANPIRYERRGFSFSYPGNWTIDTSSEHFDPDGFLILDAPTHGQVRIQVAALEVDAKEAVEHVAARFEMPGLKVNSRSQFASWGEFPGYGLTLLGEKLGDPFQVRIFAHAGSTRSIVVWEYWWDGRNSINASGYQLIESSFRLERRGKGDITDIRVGNQ